MRSLILSSVARTSYATMNSGTVVVATTPEPSPVEVAPAVNVEAEAAHAAARIAEAEIHADKEVAIAGIQADTAALAIEAATDERITTLERDLSQCRQNLETVEADNRNLRAETERLTLQVSQLAPPNPPSNEDGVDPGKTEPPPNPEPADKPKRQKSRWI